MWLALTNVDASKLLTASRFVIALFFSPPPILAYLTLLTQHKQNIMKLAQGEYVALEKIENIYSTHPIVQQFFVHGDGLKSYLLAVVVPDPVTFSQLAGKISGEEVEREGYGCDEGVVSG